MVVQSIEASIFNHLPANVQVAAVADQIDNGQYEVYSKAGSECVAFTRALPAAKALAVVRHLQRELDLPPSAVHFAGLDALPVSERVDACFLFAKLHIARFSAGNLKGGYTHVESH